VTDREIRFGMSANLSGAAKENGRQMKLGIDLAFNRVNDAGGVNGRLLKLIVADDGYEPARTVENMKQLYDKDQVFGFIGNTGTPNAVVSVPYALERRMLFFGAFTGAGVVRRDPPDRYVFNYRPSYAEEPTPRCATGENPPDTPRQIASSPSRTPSRCGILGRRKGISCARPRRQRRYAAQLPAQHRRCRRCRQSVEGAAGADQGGGHGGNLSGRREVRREDAGFFPGMIYTNVSAVGATTLAEELTLLGARYANGVIVTQVVPAVSGYSSIVLEYKNALAKYFPARHRTTARWRATFRPTS